MSSTAVEILAELTVMEEILDLMLEELESGADPDRKRKLRVDAELLGCRLEALKAEKKILDDVG